MYYYIIELKLCQSNARNEVMWAKPEKKSPSQNAGALVSIIFLVTLYSTS